MSVVNWTIGGSSLAALGLELAGGSFRAGAASEIRLRRVANFDATPLYNYGQSITLNRNGSPYFTGKVVTRPAYGTGNAEGQEILVRDAWQDLEDTIYLESWAVGSGTFDFPIAVLGIDNAGAALTTGEQIEEAVGMAIAAGATLQLGTVPAGLPLWPTEVRNVSVAEVIRISSRLHPDWVPWIDHATTPPTLNVTPRATLDARALSLAGAGEVSDFNITRRDDLKPEAVRLTYTNATIIDGVTYRDGILDKWPAAGPNSGPRVLSAVIELAGGQMQFQKSRIQTRTLPTDQASAKVWLKLKFPHLKDVPDAEFNVIGFEKELVDDDEEQPEPVNPRAVRLEVSDATDLPRELVRGTVEDWMRRKVGRIRILVTLRPSLSGASAATRAAIAKGLPPVTVTATDAVTKIYKGVTQWVAPEAAPTGIARAVYEALEAYQFEGSVTIESADVTATRYHGTGLNLTGGLSEWATMKAMVHSVTFDIDSGSTTLGFGPAPHLAAEDFLELQRMLRGRAPTWMSQDERTSNELGAENDPGSKGDTVSGFDQPETFMDPAGGASALGAILPEFYAYESEVWKVTFTKSQLWEHSLKAVGFAHGIKLGAGLLTDDSEEDPRPSLALVVGDNDIWLQYGIDATGTVVADSPEITTGAKPATTVYQPNRPSGGSVNGLTVQKLGTITVTAGGTTEPTWTPDSPHAFVNLFSPEIEHTGGGQELYNSYVEGKDTWRTFLSAEGEGVPVLNDPAVGGLGAAIVLTKVAERPADSELGYPQLRVVKVGEAPNERAEFRGNSKKGSRILRDPDGNIAWQIEWRDGFVISEGDEEYTDQCDCDDSNNM